MKTGAVLSAMSAFLVLCAAHCKADPVWATGDSLLGVIRCDVQARDSNQKLTDYQTNAVCLLLGYFRGFAESAALSAHYNATALPFCPRVSPTRKLSVSFTSIFPTTPTRLV